MRYAYFCRRIDNVLTAHFILDIEQYEIRIPLVIGADDVDKLKCFIKDILQNKFSVLVYGSTTYKYKNKSSMITLKPSHGQILHFPVGVGFLEELKIAYDNDIKDIL